MRFGQWQPKRYRVCPFFGRWQLQKFAFDVSRTLNAGLLHELDARIVTLALSSLVDVEGLPASLEVKKRHHARQGAEEGRDQKKRRPLFSLVP